MKGTGERFKKIRQALNYSQGEFGTKLGLTGQGISNIENEKSFLSLQGLEKLFDLNINLNYLIGGTGEMFNNSAADSFEDRVRKILKEENLI